MEVEPKLIVIPTVNDDELLAPLHDTLAALMKKPNGNNALFIIEPGPKSWKPVTNSPPAR